MVNQSRNMNDELGEGTTDGTYKKNPMNRSNVDYPSHRPERDELPWIYGVQDSTGINPTTGQKARRAKDDHVQYPEPTWY